MNQRPLLLALAVPLLLVACGRYREVVVRDELGYPVVDAEVWPIHGRTYLEAPQKTGTDGRAKIWISPDDFGVGVRKSGYETAWPSFPTSWPLQVTLTPETPGETIGPTIPLRTPERPFNWPRILDPEGKDADTKDVHP